MAEATSEAAAWLGWAGPGVALGTTKPPNGRAHVFCWCDGRHAAAMMERQHCDVSSFSTFEPAP